MCVILTSHCFVTLGRAFSVAVSPHRLVVSCLLAVTAVFSNVRNSLIDENYTPSSSKPVPMGWELFVGGNFETKGVWSGKDAAAYSPHDTEMSDQELYDYRVALINERYDWYKENPTRYLHHLARKVTNLWGPYKDSIGRAQKYTENLLIKNNPFILGFFKELCYLIGFFMQLALLLTVSRKKQDEVGLSMFLKALICGAFIILLFIENNPKYISCFWVPIMSITLIDSKDITQNPLLKKLLKKVKQ